MAELIVRFDCTNAGSRAEEFQHHLTDHRIIAEKAKPETQEGEVWVRYAGLNPEAVERISSEAKPWCLDRGLGVMRGTSEPGEEQATVLMIGDLTRMME
jgi:hypothetical protein